MLFGLLIVSGIALLTGCGGGGEREQPDTESVSGTVTLNGKPLAGADVNFLGQDFAGYGKTDKDGKYTLVQGATVGENLVTISKLEGEPGLEMDPDEGMDEGQLEAAGAGGGDDGGNDGMSDAPKQLVPAEFSDVDKSKLKFNVPEGGTDSANFTLTGN